MKTIILILILYTFTFSLKKPVTQITRAENDSEYVITTFKDQVNLGRKENAREDLDDKMFGYIENYKWADKTVTSIFSKDSVLKSNRVFLDVKSARWFSDIHEVYYPNGKVRESKEHSKGKIGLYDTFKYENLNTPIYTYSRLSMVKRFSKNGLVELEQLYVSDYLVLEKIYHSKNGALNKIKKSYLDKIYIVKRFSGDDELESDMLLLYSYEIYYYKSVGVTILLIVVAALFFIIKAILRRRKK